MSAPLYSLEAEQSYRHALRGRLGPHSGPPPGNDFTWRTIRRFSAPSARSSGRTARGYRTAGEPCGAGRHR
jgi:hypothetical protein